MFKRVNLKSKNSSSYNTIGCGKHRSKTNENSLEK